VTTSISAISAGVAGRVRAELGYAKRPPLRAQSDGYTRETELSKLIRYGCMFELEVHQMEELRHMRAENRQLKRDLQKRSEDSSAVEQLTTSVALASADPPTCRLPLHHN
jgi:hypothetical protein